jgi:hypothetical protein
MRTLGSAKMAAGLSMATPARPSQRLFAKIILAVIIGYVEMENGNRSAVPVSLCQPRLAELLDNHGKILGQSLADHAA